MKYQKKWSKFGASKKMVKIWSIKKNGQNLEHQKEWSKFEAPKNWTVSRTHQSQISKSASKPHERKVPHQHNQANEGEYFSSFAQFC